MRMCCINSLLTLTLTLLRTVVQFLTLFTIHHIWRTMGVYFTRMKLAVSKLIFN